MNAALDTNVLAYAEGVGNDAAKVAAWMGSYNRALNGIPRELIESPQGLVMTLQYVDAMRATS